MSPASLLFAVLALPALAAAESSAIRLAEATSPDWRGEKGLVFAADRATLAFEGGAAAPAAEVRRAPDAPFAPAALTPDSAREGRWLLDLPETGWYDIRLSHAEGAGLALTAAVVGAPIPEAWRTNSVFGLWNVHGDPALVRLAGARWNRRMTAFHSVTPEQAAEFGDLDPSRPSLATRHSSLAAKGGAAPYDERDGLRQVGVFSFGLPPWTMAIPEGVKIPSFGSLFYPATNWNDVARAVAAYARTHALPRDFSIYNEPLAHFKGKPAQIADYARAVRAGLKAADPSFRVGGPGLYSIRLRDLTAIEEGGLLESLDFLDLHAYVGGTPPEGEFVRKIEMLRDWLAAHGRPDMPVYLTEFGWTAAAGTWQPPVDRATQARYVARSLALAWSERMDALVYFALDFRTKKAGEAAFSLIGPDGRPEAGYAAFAAVSRHFAASQPIGRFQLAPGVHMVVGKRDGRLQLMAWAEEGTPPRALHLPFAIASVRDGLGAPVRGELPPLGPSPLFLETEPLPAAQLRLPTLPARAGSLLPKASNGAFWAVEPGDDPPDGTHAMFVPRAGGGWGVQPYELRSPATIEETRLAWPADSVKPVLEVVVRSHETNGTLAAALSLGNGVSTDLSLAPGATETVRWPLSGMHRRSGRRNRAAIRLSLLDGSVRERTAEWTVLPVLDAAAADHPPPLVSPWADFTDWEPFGAKAQPLVTRRSPLVTGGEAAVPDCRGEVRLLHDAEALTVEVEVRDDEHAPSSDPSRLWSADSIQLGFDLDWARPWEAGFAGAGSSQTLGGHRVFEWSVGSDGRGPAVAYRERSWDDALPVGACAAVEARVERDEAAARTRYRVRLPWAELGAAARPPRPGEAIGFSLAVNDVDPARGAPRHGLTLFGGIVDDKEPKRFGPAWLRPPLDDPAPRFGFDSWSLRAVHGAKVEREDKGSVRLRMPSAEWSCGLRLDPPAGRRSLDLSGAKWLAVDVENLSPDRQMRLTMHVSSGGANSEAADHAVANFTKNRSINTGIGLAPGEKGTMRLLLPHPEVYATPDGAPGPFLVDTHRVNAIELQCQWPFEDEFRWVVDCRLSNLRLEGEPAAPFPQGAAFLPFVDRHGQFRHAEWPEKVHSDADLRADLAREEAALAASPRPASWDRFGGWKDGPARRATGRFRTELVDGKWWLVTPEGHLFFSTGIDVVRNNTDSPDGSKHPDWYAAPVPRDGRMAFPDWNLRLKFGKDDYLDDYYRFVQRRLAAWGQNTIGNWAGRELLCAATTPYVLSLGENEKSIPHVPGGLKFYDCFDENFVPALREHLAKRFRDDPAAARARTDPLCIGFFFDNELQFNPCVAKALAAPFAECAAKRALLSRARKKYGTVEALNASWGTTFAAWEDAKAMTEAPKGRGFREDRIAFETEWFDRYFGAVGSALAEAAPGRLYLGCRFVGFRQSGHLWSAAAKHCDVISVNAYANSIANLPKAAADCGRPILLGEFHFGCLDRGMFRASLCPVGDQAERGRSYARLVEGALAHPLLVGCHWFQYRDQPLVGRGDGEAYQCGFVDVADRPYAALCAAARAVGENMYRFRSNARTPSVPSVPSGPSRP